MAKLSGARTIFRRIRGRLVPITIKGEKRGPSALKGTQRIFKARLKKRSIGFIAVNADNPVKGRSFVSEIFVNEKFRGQGIGQALFARASAVLARANQKFIRSSTILSPSQVGIRKSVGKTKFFAFPSLAGPGKIITNQKIAKSLIKRNKEVLGSTSLARINKAARNRKLRRPKR